MADLGERLRNLRAIALEHLPGGGPALASFGWIACDRCGLRLNLGGHAVTTGGMDPKLEEWGTGPEGDLCPSCMAVEADARRLVAVRDLADGRELTIQRIGPGHGRLCIGRRHAVEYVDAFDYPTEAKAREAMFEWDGRGDAPLGWIRHLTTGRRRENGDPAKERIQW